MSHARWLPALVPAVLVLAIPLATPLAAQDYESAAEPSNRSSHEAAIRSLEEAERRAVLAQDFDALERLWAPEFTVNSPMNRIAPDRAAVLDIFRRGLAHYASFDRRIEAIRFHGDVAIVMGAETVEPIGEAPHAGERVERRFTHIWKSTGGTWRLIARHASNIPPS